MKNPKKVQNARVYKKIEAEVQFCYKHFRDSIHELKMWIVELALATIASLKAIRESPGESAKHKTAGPKKSFSPAAHHFPGRRKHHVVH